MRRKFGILLISAILTGMCACGAEKTSGEAGGAIPTAEPSVTAAPAGEPTAEPEVTIETTQGPTVEPEVTAEPTAGSTTTPQVTAEPTQIQAAEVTRLHSEITFRSRELDDDEYQCLLKENWCEVQLSEADCARYPELAAALAADNEANAAYAARFIEDEYANALQCREDWDDPSMYLYRNVRYAIMRADSNVFSVKHFTSWNYGGAHGEYSNYGVNYDTKTGKVLEIWDVIRDKEKLKELLCAKLNEKYGDELLFGPVEDSMDEYLNGTYEFSWVLGYEGVTIFFNPYELASFAAGILTINIDFDECPEIFNEEYCRVPDSYVIPMDYALDNYMDIDGDGLANQISVQGIYDEYGEIEKCSIWIDGETTEWDFFTMSIEPYLVRAADGRVYLYLFGIGASDYAFARVFDLSDGTPAEQGEGYNLSVAVLASCDEYDEDQNGSGYTGCRTYAAFTDTEEFWMDSRLDALSTVYGTKSYHIGADGTPVANEDAFMLCSRLELTARMDVEMKLVDEDGFEVGSTVVPAGSVCEYYRTDNRTWADFILEDGSIGRVEITTEWPMTVNGVELDSVFEGTVFAG